MKLLTLLYQTKLVRSGKKESTAFSKSSNIILYNFQGDIRKECKHLHCRIMTHKDLSKLGSLQDFTIIFQIK